MSKPPKTAADKTAANKNAANKTAANKSGHIYIGVGGWTFARWRGVFYPEKLTQAKELE